MPRASRKGFSLVETLLYVAILGIVAVLFTSIFGVTTRVQLEEASANEVANQLNFALQTIERLVRESSAVEASCPNVNPAACPSGNGDDPDTNGVVEVAYLKLRMPESSNDPTCISLVEDDAVTHRGSIRVVQGTGSGPEQCKASAPSDAVTTSKVSVATAPGTPGLIFTKFSNPPGKDTVQIDLTLSANTSAPGGQVSRHLVTSIGRVSAATFDSALLPSIGTLDLGTALLRWQNAFVGNLDVGGSISQPGNYDNSQGRGFFIVGGQGSVSCTTICTNHQMACSYGFKFTIPIPGVIAFSGDLSCGSNLGAAGGICFCQ
jgi:type II secretory pathway pseudopilin PulG